MLFDYVVIYFVLFENANAFCYL